ncbi:MAG: CHAT domain-containing protein [Anaerolineae bacterium]|nr:CHAT domain-containing protein [Anaerolineae bacterium]
MEIALILQPDNHAAVALDGAPSHTFDLRSIPKLDLHKPEVAGIALYAALFPPGTPARDALRSAGRILLVAGDPALQAIPWEYAHDGETFLVLDHAFVRGLPADKRIAPPALDGGLHIVAVPSNPLDKDIRTLNIEGEWQRLREVIEGVPAGVVLERARPPTVEQLRSRVADGRSRIVHFMGHGSRHEDQAVLLFEQDDGAPHPVTAREFVRRVRGKVFLAMLNACISALPGRTEFSNLAAALAQHGVPYALGTQFSIDDEDARALARVFYRDLAHGAPVEEALLQARLTLAESKRPWAVSVPVLYTSLSEPAPGFPRVEGTPAIRDPRPPLEVFALPRAEGAFIGRVDELRAAGAHLTGDSRPRVLTFHGAGGQGKTALAREAVERFAHAWPGGVYAITLEDLPTRERFAADLARLMHVPTEDVADPAGVERRALAALGQRRTLVVLDNAETLAQAVERNDAAAQRLAELIREHLPGPLTTLLVTSRELLGWAGERAIDLGGLPDAEGARLFMQSASLHEDIYKREAEQLSAAVGGHPHGLRLLGGAFNATGQTLAQFIAEHEAHLLKAEDRYKGEDHRHRTLYACIETSTRHLPDDLRDLLSGLWVFHAPFEPETAADIFQPHPPSPSPQAERGSQSVPDQLRALWQRSLLERQEQNTAEGWVLMYRLLPALRLYVQHYLPPVLDDEALLTRFGAAYAALARHIYKERDRSPHAIYIAQQASVDLTRGIAYTQGKAKGYYLLHWGFVQGWLGDNVQGLKLTEQAAEVAREIESLELENLALNNRAIIYQAIGRVREALLLFERVLKINRQLENRAGEATTLHNMAGMCAALGENARALTLYKQALPLICEEINDLAYRATTLNSMGGVYANLGKKARALVLYKRALSLFNAAGNHTGEAATLNNMAGAYFALGEKACALALYEQALSICRAVGERNGEAVTLYNISFLVDTARAIEMVRQARDIWKAIQSPNVQLAEQRLAELQRGEL